MIFNVAGLMTGPVGGELRFHFENETVEHDRRRFRDVVARGRLMRTDCTVYADLKASAVFDAECSRCLDDAATQLNIEFQEEFSATNTDLMRNERAWLDDIDAESGDGNDEALTIDADNVLDLATPLWQALSAAMPMNPLCRPECRGLCAGCSADLNHRTCRCQPVAASNPFLRLQADS